MDQKDLLSQIAELIEESQAAQTRKIEVLIENKVTKRIDALFDGYKLNHEKQYELERELERRTEIIQGQIDQCRTRLELLEQRVEQASL